MTNSATNQPILDKEYEELDRVYTHITEYAQSDVIERRLGPTKVYLKAKNIIDQSILSEDTKAFIEKRMQEILGYLKTPKNQIDKSLKADEFRQNLAEHIKTAFEQIFVPHRQAEELETIEKQTINADQLKKIMGEYWDKLKLQFPEGVNAGYKGAHARIALKCIALSQTDDEIQKAKIQKMLDAEFPLNDTDIVLSKNTQNKAKIAEQMGSDLEGTETVEDINDWKTYCYTRDIDLNQVLLTKEGLYYSQQALEAVKHGTIHSVGKLNKSVFGRDRFTYKEDGYIAARGLQRLVKFVFEGKADGFKMPEYNEKIQLGIYRLVLLRKIVRKKQKGLDVTSQIYRRHSLAKTLNQTESPNPDAFIQELLDEYTDFNFNDQNDQEVIRRLLKKFVQGGYKTVKHAQHIHGGEIPEPEPKQEKVYKVNGIQLPKEPRQIPSFLKKRLPQKKSK